MFKFSKTAVAVALGTALTLPGVMANTLEGQVIDHADKARFEGASIKIKELGKSTVSQRDGSFRFANLPAGQYTLQISYLGAETVEKTITIEDGKVLKQTVKLGQQDAIENIIVVGQRAGQASALNRQRNALNLKNIVSSDSIGQLPDQNAAEALQRLPGMFILRDQGEGRFVGIRGIDPNLNSVSINGVNVPSPEAGVRSVAMDVIPSELVQSLEVSKSVTADMDASAVGGAIEVKSLSAFDRNGQSWGFTAQTSYNEQVEEVSPKLSGSFSDVYELDNNVKLGVATALSWFKRDFGSHNMETDDGWGDIEVEDAQTGDDVEFFGAEEIEQRHYRITRERLGAALNLDLHMSATERYYMRTLYSDFSDDEFRQRNEYKFDKGNLLSNSANGASFSEAKMDRDSKDRREVQKILSVVVGGERQLDDWYAESSIGYSKSNEKEPNRLDVDFEGKDIDMAYQINGEMPLLTQSANGHDLSNFDMDTITWADNHTEDEQLSVKFDLTRDFTWQGYDAEFKWGAKYTNREKFNDLNAVVYDGGFDDITAAQFAAATPNYDAGNFGPGLSQSGLRNWFNQQRGQLQANGIESDIESKGESYNSEENIGALYAMVTFEVENWWVSAGMRYEDTEFETLGNVVELRVDEVNDSETVLINPWGVKKEYSHLLPSLNVRYSVDDQWIARFAWTNTIARPTFGDSAAFQLIETETTEDDGEIEIERKAEVGNPMLDPYESSNLDLSIEYYPGEIGAFTAGIFYKDIDNFITQEEVQDNGQWDGFKEVMQAVNGGSADLSGLELSWTYNHESGLMLGANGTFVDVDDRLPNQSDKVGNLMVGFENDLLSARLSASYKSESFMFEQGDLGVYEDSHAQLDFSAKWFINDSFQLYFNAVNLTDEPYYVYHGAKANNFQYETYGRSFEVGFTFASF